MNPSVTENDIEQKFRLWCKSRGHLCLKLRPVPEGRGFPDRTVVMSNGCVVFIELKRGNRGRVSPHQEKWLNSLVSRGCNAFICRCFEEAEKIIINFED